MLLMAGRDATDAFNSYHPFTDKPRQVIDDVAVPLARLVPGPSCTCNGHDGADR